MLLDGFVVLGRLIDGRDSPASRHEALGVLSDMLIDTDGWDLSGAKARELADQILAFWDTHVAVFVLDEEEHLTSRSRVFTEIATAMWTKTCSPELLRQWVTDAIRYYDSEGVVALALGLNKALVELLLELGESVIEATLTVATAVRSNTIELTSSQLDSLVRQLCHHVSDIERGKNELPERLSRDGDPLRPWLAGRHEGGPPSWPLIEALCSLNLNETQRSQRDQALSRLSPKPPHDSIAAAWVALEDAQADERSLTPRETDVVATVLARELPKKGEMVKIGRANSFTSHGTPSQGLGQVARRAVQFLSQLPESAGEKIYAISEQVPYADGGDIKDGLRRAGVETSKWAQPSAFTGLSDLFRDWDFETMLLDDFASLGDTSTDLTKHDRWSLHTLSELLDATRYAHVGFPDFRAAFDRDDATLRRKWLRALGIAYEFDLDRVAAEAALVRAQVTDDIGAPRDWWVVTCHGFKGTALSSQASLSAGDQQVLLDCMHANSHWMVFSALYVLANTKPAWDTTAFFEVERSNWPPYRASECYLLSLLVSPEGPRLAARSAKSAEAARRHALRRALRFRHDLDQGGLLAALLGRDEDLWVRGDYDVEEPAAAYWTCRWCAYRNAPGEESCENCDLASRPDGKRK